MILSSPSAHGLQPCSLPSTGAATGLKYRREVGRAGRRKAFIVVAVNGKLHLYSLGHRPSGHPWLFLQSIHDSFWLSLQNIPKIQCSHHLHCSRPGPSPHITHLGYIKDILTGSVLLPFDRTVHAGARVTVQNSILM